MRPLVRMERNFLKFTVISLSLLLSGCFRIGAGFDYEGPPPRPAALEEYFKVNGTYQSYRSEIKAVTDEYTLKHITIQTSAGTVTVDFYQNKVPSPDMVFVFPVLGGKALVEGHFADYFARHGLDAAIVVRSNEFKDPTKFDELEAIFRKNVYRDRIAIDFFESEFNKQNFGTFGISRGGINVAITAGIDKRLKYNVIVLGGTDLVDLFRDSNQGRIQAYIKSVKKNKNIDDQQFYDLLRERIKTDPTYTAHYIDARDTLLILSIFDKTVPFEYGMRLRKQLGYPETILLTADHYVGLLFTSTASLIPPHMGEGLFPFPYVEQEAMTFFSDRFGRGYNWRIIPYRIAQFPFTVIGETIATVGGGIKRLLFNTKAAAQKKIKEADEFWEVTARMADEADRKTVLPEVDPEGVEQSK